MYPSSAVIDNIQLIWCYVYNICSPKNLCWNTPFENAQRWTGKNTFHFLLLNDDNMIGEH